MSYLHWAFIRLVRHWPRWLLGDDPREKGRVCDFTTFKKQVLAISFETLVILWGEWIASFNPRIEALIYENHIACICFKWGQNPTKRVLPPSASWHVFFQVFLNAVELQVNSSRFFCHPQHDIARDGGKGVEMSFPAWIYTYIYIYTLISCHIFGIYIHWDILIVLFTV